MNKLLLAGITTALITGASLAQAQVKPFEAIEYRQGIFKAVKWHFGPMGDMVRGKSPFDADEFTRRADLLAALSRMPAEAFIPGTYASKTSASPRIETDRANFDQVMNSFQTNTAALAAAAQSGDLKDIRPAFTRVAQTCKACHDKFRD